MKLRQIAANQTEIDMGDVVVFFSYNTPVAANIVGQGFYRTSERYSVATSRHINKWLAGAKAQEKPPTWFESLAK